MDKASAAEAARLLIAARGSDEAMAYALAQVAEGIPGWQPVVDALREMAAPALRTSALDIYRSAQVLLRHHGREEALNEARRLRERFRYDPTGLALWTRIIEAIEVLARREPENGVRQ